MKKYEFRVLISIIALILSLGALLAAFYYYKELGIKRPLAHQIETIELVRSVNIEEKGQKYEIEVSLNKVSDIQEPYQKIIEKVEASLEPGDYQLVIKDQRNTSLQNKFKDMQPAVYEALANKRFIWLDEEIARQLQKTNMKHKIFIDEEHLYLQINDGSSYLYEIINREPKE
ncbi:MAG: hypothetical protein PHX14_00345 [Syntrophomonadaceae bacterium]|nr:hypothetical protein [Syntrophomonadaceae bacterium]